MTTDSTSEQPSGLQPVKPRPEPASGGPSTDEVARQLSVILSSSRFRRSPVLRRILGFVIEETVRGDRGTLDATAIARGALGKGDGFRSSRDASVRVAMNRLRTALALYYATEGAADDIVIALEPGSNRPVIAFRSTDQTADPACEAIVIVEAYQEIITPKASALALRALRAALEAQPDNPQLLAAYTDICLDAYKFRLGTVERPLEEAAGALERAKMVDPQNPAVRFQCGMFALAHDELAAAAQCGRELVRDYPTDPAIMLGGSWLLAHTANPTRVARDHDLCLPEDTSLPGWMNHARFLASYHAREYEAALSAAIDFGMPHFFWGAIDKTAALAQLGLRDAARRQLTRLLDLNPHLVENPRWHLGHHIKHQGTLEHVLEGLCRAGLGTGSFPTPRRL
jgi:tetratricopeptide (TPR) repeat protein